MTREERDAYILAMKPVAKKSSTSYCTTGDSALSTPTRTADIEARRAAQHAAANSPETLTAKRWKAHAAHWDEIHRRAEQERVDQQAAIRANDTARASAAEA